MERFLLNLKMERVWQRDYANHGEAIRDVTDDIDGLYICVRLDSRLVYLPPTSYEHKMAAKQPIDGSDIARPLKCCSVVYASTRRVLYCLGIKAQQSNSSFIVGATKPATCTVVLHGRSLPKYS